jgi:resuscitation-promoting factor RpfA
MRRRLALVGGALAALAMTACTPQEIQLWQQWFAEDPEAAVAYANEYAAGQQAAPEQPDGVWDRIAACESGGDWSINTGNGYSGGVQFSHSTWRAYGGEEFAPLAYQASREEQIVVAERVLDDAGWGAWPTCSRQLGLR